MKMSKAHTATVLALALLLTGCKKKQEFLAGAVTTFQDDFEQYDAVDTFFFSEANWNYHNLTVEGNTLSIDSAIVHSGTRSLRCHASGTVGRNVSKASVQKQRIGWKEGDVVLVQAWFYIEGNLENLFILDIEDPAYISYSPGIRLMISKEGYLMVERGKMGLSTITQPADSRLVFPTGEWVKINYEIKFSQHRKGYVKLWQNDKLILEAHNITTMPEDFLYNTLGTSGLYTNFEIGITANGGNGPSTLYLDDLEVWKKQ